MFIEGAPAEITLRLFLVGKKMPGKQGNAKGNEAAEECWTARQCSGGSCGRAGSSAVRVACLVRVRPENEADARVRLGGAAHALGVRRPQARVGCSLVTDVVAHHGCGAERGADEEGLFLRVYGHPAAGRTDEQAQLVACVHGAISDDLAGDAAAIPQRLHQARHSVLFLVVHARNAITMHKYSACLPNLNFAANCLQKRLC
mmetsp:Transcript_1625/g.3394  ORF Transcript_1625/g.3394 Transcript_1625/m.3394 type:complete len:202 (-) Transcript_1625:326-931(-)